MLLELLLALVLSGPLPYVPLALVVKPAKGHYRLGYTSGFL